MTKTIFLNKSFEMCNEKEAEYCFVMEYEGEKFKGEKFYVCSKVEIDSK